MSAEDADVSGATRGQHRHGGSQRRRVRYLAVGRVLAATLSCTLLVAFGYGWYEYRSLNSGLNRLHLSNLGQPAGTPTPGRTVNGQEQNFLIVGLDSRNGLSAQERRLLSVGNANSLATDTIMIIHVPANGREATMISIPRDSYVDIPGGYLKNKINSAYASGYADAARSGADDKNAQAAGANVLVGAVRKLTGLTINHYVQVGFGGFYTITKAVGSIPVDLCAAADDTHAHNLATGQGSVGSDFKMSAGHHNLTPVEAVEFVRQRHNLPGGDLGREKRQRYFLAAAFNKIASAGVLLNPSKLSALIKAVTGAFYVDDNNFSLVDLANQMADLSANKIVGATIPTQGSATVQIAGQSQSVVRVDPAAVQRFVQHELSGTTTSPGSSSSTPSSPSSSSPTSAATTAPTTKGCIY
jgi:LCP family protein required for cell wall assembly